MYNNIGTTEECWFLVPTMQIRTNLWFLLFCQFLFLSAPLYRYNLCVSSVFNGSPITQIHIFMLAHLVGYFWFASSDGKLEKTTLHRKGIPWYAPYMGIRLNKVTYKQTVREKLGQYRIPTAIKLPTKRTFYARKVHSGESTALFSSVFHYSCEIHFSNLVFQRICASRTNPCANPHLIDCSLFQTDLKSLSIWREFSFLLFFFSAYFLLFAITSFLGGNVEQSKQQKDYSKDQ